MYQEYFIIPIKNLILILKISQSNLIVIATDIYAISDNTL